MSEAAAGGAEAPQPVDIRILAGSPNAEELAAATAVLSAAMAQLASEHRRQEKARPDTWARTRRNLRGALPTGWRSFGA